MSTIRTDPTPDFKHKALLFDWDGTLFDNHRFNYSALRAALNLEGFTIPEEAFYSMSGKSIREIAASALPSHLQDAAVIDQIILARDQWALANLDLAKPNRGVFSLLTNNDQRKKGVVTGSVKSNIQPFIDRYHLSPYLDVVITRDDVKSGKPSPEGYVAAIKRLGVGTPSSVLVYEDSDEGITAAQLAGADVFDVRNL